MTIFQYRHEVNAWPNRGHYFIMAVLFCALAVYGSLVPLNFNPLPINEAVKKFADIPFLLLGINSRADWVSNILLFIPFGFLWAGTFLLNSKNKFFSIIVIIGVIVFSFIFSLCIEFTQLWFPPRTVSQNDILAETIGGMIGALLWCFMGQTVTDWIHSYTVKQSSKNKMDWILEAYMVGFLLYHFLPFDITISSGEIVQKFFQGKIRLIPFHNAKLNLLSLYGWFKDIVIFIPVGVFVSTWRTSKKIKVRPIGICIVWGGIIAAFIEICQIFIYSRFADTADVLLGCIGIFIGAFCMQKIHRVESNRTANERKKASLTGWTWTLLAALYTIFLIVVFCVPFHPIKDYSLIKARYIGFFRIPFSALYYGSEFNAISEVLKKGLFFAPIGGLSFMVITSFSFPGKIKILFLGAAVGLCAGVATIIEMIQVFLPPKVPDATDVIVCTIGALTGMVTVSGVKKQN